MDQRGLKPSGSESFFPLLNPVRES